MIDVVYGAILAMIIIVTIGLAIQLIGPPRRIGGLQFPNERPPIRYTVADDIDQPIENVIQAAELEATGILQPEPQVTWSRPKDQPKKITKAEAVLAEELESKIRPELQAAIDAGIRDGQVKIDSGAVHVTVDFVLRDSSKPDAPSMVWDPVLRRFA